MAILARVTFTVGLILADVAPTNAQVDEYRVKAFVLCNFALYVEWPPEAFNSATDPIAVCVLGQNPFGAALEKAAGGRAVEGRSLIVRQIQSAPPGRACQIVFVGAREWKHFRGALIAMKGSGVLTVGETPDFARDAGVINLKLEDGKVHFEINVESAGREHLRISSKLLSLAQIVRK